MQNLMKTVVQRGQYEYELSLSWDDDAFVEGSISFNVSVLQRDTNGNEIKKDATVSIEHDENEQPILKISDGGELDVNYPLGELFDESQIIDLIPAWFFGGDPITGCLMRAGLSTSVGQIIECKKETSGVPWFIERCRAIGNILLSSIPDMSSKMARRAMRCIMRLGF